MFILLLNVRCNCGIEEGWEIPKQKKLWVLGRLGGLWLVVNYGPLPKIFCLLSSFQNTSKKTDRRPHPLLFFFLNYSWNLPTSLLFRESYNRNKEHRLTLDSTSCSVMLSSISELFPVIWNLDFCLKKQTFPSIITIVQCTEFRMEPMIYFISCESHVRPQATSWMVFVAKTKTSAVALFLFLTIPLEKTKQKKKNRLLCPF